jgi:rhodanese-related sulfurtransferase
MIAQIHPPAFQDWLAQQTDPVTVLDVREGWEVQTASLRPAGFDVRYMAMNTIPQQMTLLTKDAPIACLCHHGARSQRVAQFLVENGFSNVSNIAGGICAWSQTVDPSIPQY